ncbi:MAG: FAD-dependent monooxygenase [Actinomycetota bacterium]
MEHRPVIIVGAGPVGLGAAMELARFGVPSVVLERRATTSWHPKTRNVNTRTMEIVRGWGRTVYRRVRSIDTPPGWKSPIRFLDTATGTEFGHIDTHGFIGPGPAVSPVEPVMSSQDLVEEILVDGARATGLVDLRFSTEVVRLVRGATADDVDAAVEVEVDGRTETIEGSALLAADGAGSFVRRAIGIELEGRRELADFVNAYFLADIEPLVDDRRAVLFFVATDAADGVLQPLDASGRWLCQINASPETSNRETFSDEVVRDWVRAAVGVDDLDVEVVSVGFWQLNATVAERFVSGRTILIGDAAHQFPPTGGLGVNTGLQGMHNVIWKLAWHLRHGAPWSLVETYGTERRPLSKRITEQSLQNSGNVARIRSAMTSGGVADGGTPGDTMALGADELMQASNRYGNHLGIEFGSIYESSAVVPDGTAPPPVADDYADYVASATPGARAPHHWLGAEDERLSTIDLVGTGLTLLAGPDGGPWIEAARAVAADGPVPIDAYRIGDAGLTDRGDLPGVYGIGTAGAVLIRPDGHVAWRRADGADGPDGGGGGVDGGGSGGDTAERVLREVIDGVLGR